MGRIRGAACEAVVQDGVRGLFDGEKTTARSDAVDKVQVSALHEKVGQLIMERDFFSRKVWSMSQAVRRAMVSRAHGDFSVVAQCALLKVPRSTVYYRAKPISDETLSLMRRIDEIYTKWPFYGARKMVAELQGEGNAVNRKRVRRLMRLIGIEAIYQKPNTTANIRITKYTRICAKV